MQYVGCSLQSVMALWKIFDACLITTILYSLSCGQCEANARLRYNKYRCYDARPRITNGYYEVLRADGRAITARCADGFRLSGTDPVRLCDDKSRSFTGADPMCKDIDECSLMRELVHAGKHEIHGSGFEPASSQLGDDDTETGMAYELDLIMCDSNADCFNQPGSYRCVCKQGLIGDGFHCKKALEVPTSCSPITRFEHGWIKMTASMRAQFYCSPTYYLWGQREIRCKNGKWTNAIPKCLQSLFGNNRSPYKTHHIH